MGRPSRKKKAAAVRDLAHGEAPEVVQQKHGIKSRSTLERWTEDARRAEQKGRPHSEEKGEESANGAAAPPSGDKAEGEAEMLLTMVRFGVAFTVKSAGMVVGFAPTSPVVVQLSKLQEDEEIMLRRFAPALLPAWDKLLSWLEGHAVASMAAMFAAIMLPRVVTLGMAGKKVREMQRQTAAREPKKAEPNGEAAAAAAPPTSPPAAAGGDATGVVLSLYPKPGGES